MQKYRFLVGLIICFSLMLYSSNIDTAVNSGIQWLKVSQNIDGSWGGDSAVSSFVSTATVCEALGALNPLDSAYIAGVAYLETLQTKNCVWRAEKIKALIPSGIDTSLLRDTLLSYSFPSGGSTFDKEGRDILSTVFFLDALYTSGYKDYELIGRAIGYILSEQDTSGCWRYNQENISNLYLTTLSLISLEHYHSIFNVSSSIDKGIEWIMKYQHSDGGFGLDTSSVYETALSLIAIVREEGIVDRV